MPAKALCQAARAAIVAIAAVILSACGSAHQAAPAAIPAPLLSEARPIGTGPRFQPPATGPVAGRCERTLGRRTGVHVEVFAANRVVILPAGIGTRPPRTFPAGRITRARCYGVLVTLDATGLVLVRSGARLPLSALFRSWGQRLSLTRLGSFRAPEGAHVTTWVNGRPWHDTPGAVPLTPHAEIVLEIGPHVPPHQSYAFPQGT